MAENEQNNVHRVGDGGLSLEEVKIRIKELWGCDPIDQDEHLQQQFLESNKEDLGFVIGAIEEIIKELWNKSQDEIEIHNFLELRQELLNEMFKVGSEEISALKALNETLAKLEDELNTKSLQLWNAIKQTGIYNGEWLVRGILDVVNEEVHHIDWGYLFDKYAFCKLPSDAEFGSDFKYMVTLIGNVKELPLFVVYLESSCDLSDKSKETEDDDKFYFFKNLNNAAYEAIKKIGFTPCKAMAQLLQDFSIPDILRINRFANKVEFTQATVYDHSGSAEFESEMIMPPGYEEED